MELAGTEALLALAREGTVFQAARQLGISRPTLRRRIQALGDELGVELVESIDGKLILTPSGRTVAEAAPALLRARDALRALLHDSGAHPRGVLRVASPPGAARPLTRALLHDMLATWPRRRMELHASLNPVALLDGGPDGRPAVDLALTTSLPDQGDLMARRLGTVHVGLFATPSYIASRGLPETLDALRDHNLLQVELPPIKRGWPLAGGGSLDIPPLVRSNDGGLISELVRNDHGIALLPTILAPDLVPVLPTLIHRSLPIIALMAPERLRLRRVQVFLAATEAMLARAGAAGGP